MHEYNRSKKIISDRTVASGPGEVRPRLLFINGKSETGNNVSQSVSINLRSRPKGKTSE